MLANNGVGRFDGGQLRRWLLVNWARVTNLILFLLVVAWALPAPINQLARQALGLPVPTIVQSMPEWQLPTAPIPSVPVLNAGSIGLDRPEATPNGEPQVIGDVAGREFAIIGAWSCWPVEPAKPWIQVRVKDGGDMWVMRGAIPLSNAELAPLINSVTQHNGKVCSQ